MYNFVKDCYTMDKKNDKISCSFKNDLKNFYSSFVQHILLKINFLKSYKLIAQ